MADEAALYDHRYERGYRAGLSSYEIARVRALGHAICKGERLGDARRVLDYGGGSGVHAPLWQRCFPNAELWLADISPVALRQAEQRDACFEGRTRLIAGDRTDLPGGAFDVITSVEVMEHVEDLDAYLKEIRRLLAPGGAFVWTTPCRNFGSVEYLIARASGRIVRSRTGERRWSWEDPTHLRRLTSGEATRAVRGAGFAKTRVRYRAHLMSWLCDRLVQKRAPRLSERLMLLDYTLLRRLPMGASMVGVARAPGPRASLAAIRAAAAA